MEDLRAFKVLDVCELLVGQLLNELAVHYSANIRARDTCCGEQYVYFFADGCVLWVTPNQHSKYRIDQVSWFGKDSGSLFSPVLLRLLRDSTGRLLALYWTTSKRNSSSLEVVDGEITLNNGRLDAECETYSKDSDG